MTATDGTVYAGWEGADREPNLFACSDYHRATSATGWVTFEIRDKHAKGLRLDVCGWAVEGCGAPEGVKIS